MQFYEETGHTMVTGRRTLLFLATTSLWLAPSQSVPSRRALEDSPCDEAHDKLLCGSNDVTYLNICELEKDLQKDPTLKIVQNGACPCDTKETHEWDPLCASNGQSYANNCELAKARKLQADLRVRHLGLCNSLLKRDTITYRQLQQIKMWRTFMPKTLFKILIGRYYYAKNEKSKPLLLSFGKNTRDKTIRPKKKTYLLK